MFIIIPVDLDLIRYLRFRYNLITVSDVDDRIREFIDFHDFDGVNVMGGRTDFKGGFACPEKEPSDDEWEQEDGDDDGKEAPYPGQVLRLFYFYFIFAVCSWIHAWTSLPFSDYHIGGD